MKKISFPGQEGNDSFFFENNFRGAKVFLSIFFLILFSRLWYLQILNGEDFRKFSEKNLLKESDVYAPRGKIFDRDGQVLVENLPAYKAIITPQYTKDLDSLAKDLSPIIDVPVEEIIDKVNKSRKQNGRFFPVDIKLHLTRDELFKVELMKVDHAGLDTQEFILRYYPYAGESAHVLGYVREISQHELPVLRKKHNINYKQKDIIGKKGLEESYDSILRGQKGQTYVIVDAKGQQRPESSMTAIGEILKSRPAIPGADIYTTLDFELQQVAFDTFKKYERVGSLIAMTPKGEILAWVSYPPFDPNLFSTRVSPQVWRKWVNNSDRPLRNKAIQDHYAPGSTFKPIVALAALQENIITEWKKVNAPSKIRFGGRWWHDHSQQDYGMIALPEALERSSNIFFFKLGEALGPDKISIYARALGLGDKTEIPIQGEVSGHIPTTEWKQKRFGEPWQGGESFNTAIGQGHVLTTTIQLAQAYSAIALDGAVYQPQIISKIEGDAGGIQKVFEPKLLRNLSEDTDAPYFVEKKHFETVKKGLWRVVNGTRGTAQRARMKDPFSVSGKTGTAQVRRFSADQIYLPCMERTDKREKHNGWFVGYGSKNDVPEITVAVLTEHSCTSAAAVPLAKEVIEAYFKKYHNMKVKADNKKVIDNES